LADSQKLVDPGGWRLGGVGSFDARRGGGLGARGYDCGPEPSLRTAPASTSSAFGSLRFPSGASTRPAHPGRRHAGLRWLALGGRWGGWGSLGSCGRSGWDGAVCGARPTAAARAAWWGLRGVLRRGDGAARWRAGGFFAVPCRLATARWWLG